MDLYEIFGVIPAYKDGDRQPLVDLLKAHKQNGKPLSPAIFDVLIEMAEKANLPRQRGGRTKLGRKGEIKLKLSLRSVSRAPGGTQTPTGGRESGPAGAGDHRPVGCSFG